MKHRSSFAALAVVGSLLGSAGTARADATCISAYEQTQTLRKDGKPVAAKVQAAICAQTTCPALLTKDCTRWLAELEQSIPSVILDPRAPTGGARADVRVKVDGTVVATVIDGKPVIVEPGSHAFVFEADGAAPVEQTVVVRDGEKNKKITVVMAPAATAKNESRPLPLGFWVFGGVGVVALATSVIFGLDGLGKKSDLDQCKPHCAPDDVDAMTKSFTFADVALGAGVVAGAAAVYLLLTRPTVEATNTAQVHRFRPIPFAGPLPGGGALGLSGAF